MKNLTKLTKTVIAPPEKWDDSLEHYPFANGTFSAATAEEVVSYLVAHTALVGDETVEVSYEREEFDPDNGWDWVECDQKEATRASIRLNSEITNAKYRNRRKSPIDHRSYGSGDYGGYKDYS